MSRPRIAIPVPSTDPEYSARAWQQYATAVEQSGGEAVEVPLGEPPATTARLIAECQGVLLPGSPADVNPQKYGQKPVAECAPADLARENVERAAAAGRSQYGQADLHHLLWDPDAECVAGWDAGAASDRTGGEPQAARRCCRSYSSGCRRIRCLVRWSAMKRFPSATGLFCCQ